MNFVILICNRLIKILANGSKVISYIFHFFVPNKRFTIPKHAPSYLRANPHQKIPAILWQTNFSNRVTLPIYMNYVFNRLMSPNCEYRFMDNEDCLAFIKENYSQEILESYKKLKIGAAKADFWRVLALNKVGGIYMDIDGHLIWPVPFMIKPEDEELFVKSTGGLYTNYFMASKKGNPHLEKIIQIVLQNIRDAKSDSVYTLTGPPTVNQALGDQKVHWRSYRYTCVQGSFTNEHFQYLDKPKGKWTHAKREDLLG